MPRLCRSSKSPSRSAASFSSTCAFITGASAEAEEQGCLYRMA